MGTKLVADGDEIKSPGARLCITPFSQIKARAIDWLWPGYAAYGKLTVIEGDPGLGKSTLLLEIAARVSRGHAMPGGHELDRPWDVFILSYEDAADDTIKPRLEAAGADMGRVHMVTVADDTDLVTLPDDIPELRAAIEAHTVGLLIVDPLSAALSALIDSHKDQSIRRALAPLAKLADVTGCAVLALRHLRKEGGNGKAITAGQGSAGIGAAARTVLTVGQSEDDPERRVLAVVKCNIYRKMPSLAFKVEQRTVMVDGSSLTTSRVTFLGASRESADDLAAARCTGGDGDTQAVEIEANLREWLREATLDSREIRQLCQREGYDARVVRRIASNIGVIKDPTGFGKDRRTTWYLRPISDQNPEQQLRSYIGEMRRNELTDSGPAKSGEMESAISLHSGPADYAQSGGAMGKGAPEVVPLTATEVNILLGLDDPALAYQPALASPVVPPGHVWVAGHPADRAARPDADQREAVR